MTERHQQSSADTVELKPCPFCGGKAEIERRGTARQSCIIACESCGCRLETGEVWSMGERWNTRHNVDAAQPVGMCEALEQIAIVCTDNMDRSCDHRMALDFVRQVANDALAAQPPAAPVEAVGEFHRAYDAEKSLADYQHGYADGVEWAQTHGARSSAETSGQEG